MAQKKDLGNIKRANVSEGGAHDHVYRSGMSKVAEKIGLKAEKIQGLKNKSYK